MSKPCLFALFLALSVLGIAHADVASVDYVDTATNTKVDTGSDTDQTLAGKYIVTGTLEVPDAPLPSAN